MWGTRGKNGGEKTEKELKNINVVHVFPDTCFKLLFHSSITEQYLLQG